MKGGFNSNLYFRVFNGLPVKKLTTYHSKLKTNSCYGRRNRRLIALSFS